MKKIVMLGFTGVGKTTYMGTLYGALQRQTQGFTLKATDSEDRKRLLELADDVLLGKYPPPTSQRSEYEFQLMHEGKEVISFIWSDYRGGALRETQDSDQARFLVQDLRRADGIMIFCDFDALSSKNTRKNQLGRMVALVSNALQKLEKSLSLAIVLTKCDLVDNFSAEMLEPFGGLVSAIEANESIQGAFIPVACGRKMVNVPIPLLFALHAGLLSQTMNMGMGALSLLHLIKNSKLPLIRKGITFKEYQKQIQGTKHGIGFDRIPGMNGFSPFDPFKAFE